MINFRFHLISLVAVFLALALGVVMGSTVIDRAIVDRLSSQIESVRQRSDARRQENLALKAQIDGLQAFIDQAVPQVVRSRLQGVPVAVVAMRGVEGDTVRAAAETLRTSGAALAGVAWIEPSIAAADPATETKLAQVIGAPPGQGVAARDVAVQALGHRLTAGAAATARTAASAPSDLLVALAGAGFLAFDSLGGPQVDLAAWPAPGSRLLVIDGTQAKMETTIATLPLIQSASAAGAAVTLAEVFRPTSLVRSRGTVIRSVRETPDLASRVATVDDLEEIRGRVALVLAVEEVGHGRAGHYGEGPGATRQLPEPSPAQAGGTPADPRAVPTAQAVSKP
jgi:Copper transport outer membrane protein, MctB